MRKTSPIVWGVFLAGVSMVARALTGWTSRWRREEEEVQHE